jgi:hypothetical protein
VQHSIAVGLPKRGPQAGRYAAAEKRCGSRGLLGALSAWLILKCKSFIRLVGDNTNIGDKSGVLW